MFSWGEGSLFYTKDLDTVRVRRTRIEGSKTARGEKILSDDNECYYTGKKEAFPQYRNGGARKRSEDALRRTAFALS